MPTLTQRCWRKSTSSISGSVTKNTRSIPPSPTKLAGQACPSVLSLSDPRTTAPSLCPPRCPPLLAQQFPRALRGLALVWRGRLPGRLHDHLVDSGIGRRAVRRGLPPRVLRQRVPGRTAPADPLLGHSGHPRAAPLCGAAPEPPGPHRRRGGCGSSLDRRPRRGDPLGGLPPVPPGRPFRPDRPALRQGPGVLRLHVAVLDVPPGMDGRLVAVHHRRSRSPLFSHARDRYLTAHRPRGSACASSPWPPGDGTGG